MNESTNFVFISMITCRTQPLIEDWAHPGLVGPLQELCTRPPPFLAQSLLPLRSRGSWPILTSLPTFFLLISLYLGATREIFQNHARYPSFPCFTLADGFAG